MSRRGPEGRVQDTVIRHARANGLLCKKNEVGRYFVQSGWPDYMIFGRRNSLPWMIFMEFKAPGGALTPLQKKIKTDLDETCPFPYYVVCFVEDGKKILDREFD